MRNQPVKRYDGEPLTRVDVQHAMLCYLFSDTRRVFTNPRAGPRGPATSTFVQALGEAPSSEAEKAPAAGQPPAVQVQVAQAIGGPFPTTVWPYGQSAGSARRSDEREEEFSEWKTRRTAYLEWREANYPSSITPVAEGGEHNMQWEHPGAEKLTFKELYIEALMNSSKCTKSMREKCLLDEEYAEDFSKVCLLVNVGRINTTLAFYPEMKTILRSYHPVPSLQKALIPLLSSIPLDAFTAEDADTPEEIEWGKQMQQERAAFLVRFQEEEQAKVLANGGSIEEDATNDEAKPKRQDGMHDDVEDGSGANAEEEVLDEPFSNASLARILLVHRHLREMRQGTM
ncbi:RNA helicase [Malassezia obtusa]|uniref:RNA helicase n=1 Tax=Malassezia obtusa TaxID=76774 RepID=A0AAF0DZU4_9BASI|nr:RNA helicase [Malassezia obtusa]